MRAEILGIAARFEVQAELQPDGRWAPPATVTLTLRPCWRKPPVPLSVRFLYMHEELPIAYYAVVKGAANG